jgi:6-phosphogluconolactonase (cycloisomerase 2 family)
MGTSLPFKRVLASAFVGLSIAAFAAWPAIAAQGKGKGKSSASVGFLFDQSNSPKANSVFVFKRKANGTIKLFETIKTGGKGTSGQQPFGLPIVDSADGLILSPDHKLLFVVNDGSNSVTSFRVKTGGITRADVVKSEGKLPISLAVHGDLLYVLNGVSGNIAGFTFNSLGKLTPIAHSKQSLSVHGPNGVAADIGFNPSGKWLVAALRNLPTVAGNTSPGILDTFAVHSNGSVGPAVQTVSPKPTAFGFRFLPSGILVDTSAGVVKTVNNSPPPITDGSQINGSLQTYSIAANGKLHPISNAATGGRAACWVVLSKNNKFAFVTNTLSATAANPVPGNPVGTGVAGLARLSVAPNGTVKLLGTVNTGPGFASDESVSPDGKYLYVTVASMGLLPVGSHIDVFKIGSNGSLTPVQATNPTFPIGLGGAATT